jgi:hypothetical protein
MNRLIFKRLPVFTSMTASFEQASQQQGATTGPELDEVKRMLTETNPWFLALTGAVSVLHMLLVLAMLVQSYDLGDLQVRNARFHERRLALA